MTTQSRHHVSSCAHGDTHHIYYQYPPSAYNVVRVQLVTLRNWKKSQDMSRERTSEASDLLVSQSAGLFLLGGFAGRKI